MFSRSIFFKLENYVVDVVASGGFGVVYFPTIIDVFL